MAESPFDRAARLFLSVREVPAAERAGWLAQECGADLEVRALVEKLLAGEARPLPFAELARDLGSSGAEDETEIGPYRILERLGEGGFGTVYLAEQSVPVRRRVALKVLKPGMDTRRVIARFEAERQVLALMEHPNIARVLDAGATKLGRPFFVMELIRGLPITQHCVENSVPLQERLRLFVAVCQAVQHAHTKGIIHRDLKPSNVLVAVQDGKALPRVIDFGIAKVLHRIGDGASVHTEARHFIGTPEYVSPEQADPAGREVDTRADVWSLGVLLHELVTGATPFPSPRLRAATVFELHRILSEEDPPPPSRSVPGLPRELDWIVLRCLEKLPSRRYETAADLARDLERFLAHEAVLAGPRSRLYVASKFVRRHRGSLCAALAVLVTLVVGLVIASIGFMNARHERDRATAQRMKAEGLVVELRSMLARPELDEAIPANFTVLAMLDSYAASLASRPPMNESVEASVRLVLGGAFLRASALESAEVQLALVERCLCDMTGDREQLLAETRNQQAMLARRRANLPLAEDLVRDAVQLYVGLGEEHALDRARAELEYARILQLAGRDAEAREHAAKALQLVTTHAPGNHELLAAIRAQARTLERAASRR